MRKKWIIAFVFLAVLILLLGSVYAVFFMKNTNNGGGGRGGSPLQNPIDKIISRNIDASGKVDPQKVIDQGIKEFNVDYINYILLAMGVGNLHGAMIFGDPVVELAIDDQVWNSEIKNGGLYTQPGLNDKRDLRITLSKEEAVKALISNDIRQFMKDSVMNGNTRIEMIAGKPELLAKGYLDMYNKLKA